jgi:hypothetical protein
MGSKVQVARLCLAWMPDLGRGWHGRCHGARRQPGGTCGPCGAHDRCTGDTDHECSGDPCHDAHADDITDTSARTGGRPDECNRDAHKRSLLSRPLRQRLPAFPSRMIRQQPPRRRRLPLTGHSRSDQA